MQFFELLDGRHMRRVGGAAQRREQPASALQQQDIDGHCDQQRRDQPEEQVTAHLAETQRHLQRSFDIIDRMRSRIDGRGRHDHPQRIGRPDRIDEVFVGIERREAPEPVVGR